MTTEKKARIGFIGCGEHATSSLYPMLHLIPEIEFAAVCDLKEELARRNARAFGAGNCYTDMDKMLSTEQLDGVVIVGPPQMHCEIGKQCLDAGLPIFVEKPSAVSYREALELAEYARGKNLFGAVAFMKRQSTCYRMAKAIVEKEEFGKINEIEVRFANGRYPSVWGIKEPARAILIGQAVHMFDLVRFFCGDVREVYAVLREVETTREGGIFGYAVTLAFRDGAIGVMNVNAFHCPNWQMSEYFAAAGSECWLEVKDMVLLNYHPRKKAMPEFDPQGRAQTLTWSPELSEILRSKAEGMAGYKGELQNFARAILGTARISADLFDGAKTLQIAEAIWESSQTGKPINLGA